jgi:putative ABC transport system ATP-binding protein
MGPSGSGKTTLLALTGGLDAPTAGNVVVEGVHLSELSRRETARLRRTSIGYVFQDYNLIPALTAAENVALPLELDGMRAGKAGKLAVAALAEVGLDGLGGRFPEEMSGGQRQRTAIARALIGRRRLVLADEPTGNLDSANGREVLNVLERLNRERGVAVVLVTHDAEVAARATRLIRMRDGLVVSDTEKGAQSAVESGGESGGAGGLAGGVGNGAEDRVDGAAGTRT